MLIKANLFENWKKFTLKEIKNYAKSVLLELKLFTAVTLL